MSIDFTKKVRGRFQFPRPKHKEGTKTRPYRNYLSTPGHRAGTETRPYRRFLLYLFLLFFLCMPCSGQTVSKNPPRVLFMEHPGSNPSDAALFTAIRAQLSVSSLSIERAAPSESSEGFSDLSASAPRLASEHHATLVFWIEDEDPCQIHFFVPNDKGGQFSSRTIEVDSKNQSSRYDVIAVVAAVTIEGLIVPNSPAPPPSKKVPEKNPVKTQKSPRLLEINAAYSGSLTAADTLSHGGAVGLGILPLRRLFVGLSFSLFAPTTLSNERLQIELISRRLEVDTAVRLVPSPFEIRLGVSYSADVRSYSTTALDDTIRSRKDGYNTVHAFVPFLFGAWTYRDRIGIFGKVGVSLAINETVYRIRHTNGEFTEELAPFDAKLIYQFGLLLRL